MIEHSTIPTGDRHGIANWEFASYAARDAQAVSLADVGKVGHVVGKGHFALASVSPTVWEPMTSAEDIDLENVDNTSDADKPVSTLQAAAIADSLRIIQPHHSLGILSTWIFSMLSESTKQPPVPWGFQA